MLLEERIKLAVEATGIGTWDYDPVHRVAVYDEQCKKLFGFTGNHEFTYSHFLACIDPSDRAERERVLYKVLVEEKNGRYDTQYRIKTIDQGITRWISSRGKVYYNEEGDAVRLIGTMLDVTREKISEQKLRESEARFRLASDASTAMIWMTGQDKKANYFNKTWLRFRGRKLEEEMGEGWTEGIHPEDAEKSLSYFEQKFRERKEFHMEYRMRRHDGAYRWVSDSGAPRFSVDGFFEGYIGTCMDIHDQKLSHDQLEQLVEDRTTSLQDLNNQLEATNQNLTEFAYAASHDLQEPLRKINTFTAQLKEKSFGDQEEEVNTYLNKISGSSKRMSRLIDDLLNYARLQNTEEAKQQTDLTKIVQTLLHDFDLEIVQKDATIIVGHLPVIHAIPLRMTQLFHNLLSNSLKFTIPGQSPRIIIQSATLTEKEKKEQPSLNPHMDYDKITFTDNGIGFNPQFAEKIFNIFQRLNGKSAYEGTGIGLTLCRKIVLNHHGLIFASSRENEGSTFTIIFPAGEKSGER